MQATNSNSRSNFFLSSVLGLGLLLACSFGCAPSASQGDGGQNASASNDALDITDELINERINEAWIREVHAENGTAEPINWNFDYDEPKEITVVDKKVDGTRATIILDIKTGSAPRARVNRQLAGQIRTEWELRTGWVLRRWEIVDAENISMKYKDLPKPLQPLPEQNSNR